MKHEKIFMLKQLILSIISGIGAIMIYDSAKTESFWIMIIGCIFIYFSLVQFGRNLEIGNPTQIKGS